MFPSKNPSGMDASCDLLQGDRWAGGHVQLQLLGVGIMMAVFCVCVLSTCSTFSTFIYIITTDVRYWYLANLFTCSNDGIYLLSYLLSIFKHLLISEVLVPWFPFREIIISSFKAQLSRVLQKRWYMAQVVPHTLVLPSGVSSRIHLQHLGPWKIYLIQICNPTFLDQEPSYAV